MNGMQPQSPVKHAEKSLLSKCCPVCGGRSWTEAKLPLAHGARPAEFNLDEMDALVSRHTIGFLLALLELLPYKQFVCQKCRHEFRMANSNAKALVRAMLAGMQPVSDSKPKPRTSHVQRKPAAKPTPKPAVTLEMPKPSPAQTQAGKPGKAGPAPDAHPADWQPFHVETDLDALFDEFDKP